MEELFINFIEAILRGSSAEEWSEFKLRIVLLVSQNKLLEFRRQKYLR